MINASLVVILISAHICLYKTVFAENTAVRIAAADSFNLLLVTTLALLSVFMNAAYLLDIALVYALLAFIDTLAWAKYFEKRMLHK